ncbi:hypothetical protein COCOBI_10-0440 [Coccomyxa sp. Obi]|nr:hypothetical protein COCOBI_10-0440 [Coccomyxa sp. Obi]
MSNRGASASSPSSSLPSSTARSPGEHFFLLATIPQRAGFTDNSRTAAGRQAQGGEYAVAGLMLEAAECAAHVRDSDMLGKLHGMVGTVLPLSVAVAQLK